MRKITTLDNISDDLVATDLFEVVDISDDSMAESGTNKNISASQLANGLSRILSDRVSIVTSTSDNAVLISQSGGGNALLIRDEANDASPFVVNGIGNVGIGTQLPTEKLDVIGIVKATGFVGPLTGNSSTATALASPRTIAITGDITGTATSFDGTSNITISSSITAGSIVNADINPSAAIAGTKIIPDFGSQSITAAGNLVLTKGASDTTTISAQTTSGVVLNVNAIANTEGNIRTATNHPLTFSTNNAERVRINSNGSTRVGAPNTALSTAIETGHIVGYQPPALTIYSPNGSTLATCSTIPHIRQFGIGGTIDTPTAVGDGTNIGGMVGFGWNGSAFNAYGSGGSSAIFITSKGAHSTTNSGSLITFTTTQENTVGAVERMRIDHNGNVGIGESASITNKLTIVGDGINVKPPSYTSSYAGGIKFRNDGYSHFTAGVKGTAFVISNTGADGNTIWPTVGQGTIDVMRLDKTGVVTIPHIPSFRAVTGQATTAGNAVGAYVLANTQCWNTGNHFNLTTGVFTAPVAGLYYFRWNHLATTNAVGEYRFFIRVNGGGVPGAGFIYGKDRVDYVNFLSLHADSHLRLMLEILLMLFINLVLQRCMEVTIIGTAFLAI